MRRFYFLLLAALLFCTRNGHAQLAVNLEIKNRFLIMYEPIVATVSIRNLSGRDVTLADSSDQNWFAFQIVRPGGRYIAPLNPDYKLTPLTVQMGQTVKRSIILNAVYPVCDTGSYRVRATINHAELGKAYQSQSVNVEISEGKTVWQQIVGVPEGKPGAGGTRKYSLLSFRQSENNYLYTRVENVESGTVFTTMQLGRLGTVDEPEAQTDLENNLHVLQFVSPKVYLYSNVSISGDLLEQKNYYTTRTRPTLHRDTTGRVRVLGGSLVDPASAKTKATNKLSDRPVEIPKE